MLIIPVRELKTQPYNDPNVTRDELVFYIKPLSYVLPISCDEHENAIIGNWAWKKVLNPWRTTGDRVYLLNIGTSTKLMRESKNLFGKEHPLVEFFMENRYVTRRIHYIEFSEVIKQILL